MKHLPEPPRLGIALLKEIYGEELFDEIYGDLYEIYLERIGDRGKGYARFHFILDVVLSIRNYNLRKKPSHSHAYSTLMLSNYLKTAVRFILKNKIYAGLNVLGLTIGIVACLLILMYVAYESRYEDFHKNADRIARVSVDVYHEGALDIQDAMSYPAVGPELKAKYPVVEEYVHFYPQEGIEIKVGNQVFKEDNLYFTESSCFEVFTFEFIQGNPEEALTNPFEVVLTASTARKYFGKTDVIGEQLYINAFVTLTVVGVIKDVPPNSHIQFDLLISYDTGTKVLNWDTQAWNMNNEYTYVLLTSPNAYDIFVANLKNYTQELIQLEKLDSEELIAQRLSDIHLYSHKTYEMGPNGDARSVYFLGIIAIFIVILASVNYVNLSLARSLERAKEVGIRKVIGSQRKELIGQFLTETALITFVAGLLAFLAFELSLPFFRQLTGIPESISFYQDSLFWLLLVGLILFTISISGIYPAFVLSRHKPITVLKGRFSHSQQGISLRKGLVVFQFSISIILTVGAFVVGKQLRHLQQTDLGMNVAQTLVIEAPFTDSLRRNYSAFREELLAMPAISQVSKSGSVPGISESSTTSGIPVVGSGKRNNFTFNIYHIDEHFVELMDMKLVAGQNFQSGNDQAFKVLVNEEAVRLWDLSPKEAVGKELAFWDKTWTISGVLKNYYQHSPKDPHIPIILYSYDFNGSWQYTSLQLQNAEIRSSVAAVERIWEAHFPNSVFEYFFLDQFFNQQYVSDQRFATVFRYATLLAIFIACLGLLGISTYTAQQRTEEIGIRKVLGASLANLVGLLMKGYAGLIAIAIGIAIPTSIWGVHNWLENFAVRIELDLGLFLIPVLMVIGFAILATAWQTLRLARTNPVQALKDE